MNLTATINSLVTALQSIPAAVTAAQAALVAFETFLATNL
jgi:hypothetical protein